MQFRICRFAKQRPNVTAVVTPATIKTISMRQFSVLCAILLGIGVGVGSGEHHYERVCGASTARCIVVRVKGRQRVDVLDSYAP